MKIKLYPGYLIVLLLALLPGVFRQPVAAQAKPGDGAEKLQQQKVAFFNEKLQLSQNESTRFWPVYNDYQNRRDKITRDRNTLMRYYEQNRGNLTDAEARETINKYLGFQQEETRLLEQYTRRFEEILPPRKVMHIFFVELEFKKWLLDQLRENKSAATPRK